jgi:hypothetical protein
MPRKRRPSHKGPRRRHVPDLSSVEFLVSNEQKIFHSVRFFCSLRLST